MKQLLFVLLSALMLAVSPQLIGADLSQSDVITTTISQTCEDLKQSGATAEQLARRGCCSWHDGVCGCSGGRIVCCDGSYSPSCTCNKSDPIIDAPQS